MSINFNKINNESELLKYSAGSSQLSTLRSNKKKSDFDLKQWSDINDIIQKNEKYSILDKLDQKHRRTFNTGFSNLGNTCYINSILQCLLNIDSFTLELDQIYKKHYCLKNILGKNHKMNFSLFSLT